MRLVRFEDESGEFAVELHPLLTVISGLDPRLRDELIRTMSAIPRGADPRARGSIEVHGVYLDLNRETLELLEMHQDVDVVVRSTDLPGADEPLAGLGASRSTPTSSYAPPAASGAEPSDESTIDIDEARARAAEIEAAQDELAASIEQLRAQLVTLGAERHGLGMQVESSRAALDSFAVAALKVARDDLAEIESRATDETNDDVVAERAELEERIAELTARSEVLDREAERLAAIDPEPVRAAFADLDAALETSETIPSPEAQGLLAEWNELSARIDQHEAEIAGEHDQAGDLVARRDQCLDEVAVAERSIRNPPLDPELVESLETIHDEIFELDGKASKLGGSKIRRRQEELRRREDEVLTKLGFDTWSSYVMGLSSAHLIAQRQATLDSARAALEAAEAALAEAPDEPEVTDELASELEASKAELIGRIRDLVGDDADADPVAALEVLEVNPDDSRPDADSAAAALGAALEETGTVIDAQALEIDELHSVAAGWLETMAELPERVAVIEAERVELEADLAAQTERLEALPVDDPDPGDNELEEARRRVAEAEERVELHEAAAARLAELSLAQEQLNGTERDLQFSVGERERQLAEYAESHQTAVDLVREGEEAEQARAAARATVPRLLETAPLASMVARHGTRRAAGAEALEWYVLARLAQQRAISFAGSVPILIDDAFADWSFDELDEVFARLERMSEVIQIVYLTDDPDVANWGRNLGRTRAQVLDLRNVAV